MPQAEKQQFTPRKWQFSFEPSFEFDFYPDGVDHQLTLYLMLSVSERERGIVVIPKISGNCMGGAVYRSTINKLTIAIANYFPDAHPLLKEMTIDSYPVIHWSDIDLNGIRSVATLFKELYEHNGSASKLADSNVSPFIPSPRQALAMTTLLLNRSSQNCLGNGRDNYRNIETNLVRNPKTRVRRPRTFLFWQF